LLQFRKILKVQLSSLALKPMYDAQHPLSPKLNKMMIPDIYVTVQTTDNVKNFLKHIRKATFLGKSRHIFNFFLEHPELKKPIYKVATLIQEVLQRQNIFCHSKASQIDVATF
jgi:hypothetical protein